MIRSVVLVLASVVGMLGSAPAEAQPIWERGLGHSHLFFGFRVGPVRPCLQYHVLVRDCFCEPWQCYGVYADPWLAERVACRLRLLGFQVRVVVR
jgi:hypothetical protein